MKKSSFIYFLPFAIVSLSDIFFKLGFEKALSLNPLQIYQTGEFWKIFTFPLIDSSIASILILGLVSLVFVPQLLKFFRKFHLVLLVSLLILMQGTAQIIVFWSKDITFSGFSSVSSFLMVLTILIYPKVQLRSSSISLGNNLQAVLIIFLLFISIGFERIWEGSLNSILSFLFPILFGGLTAFLVILQIYLFRKYYLPKKQAKSITEIAELLSQARESMQKLESSLVEEPVGVQQLYQEKRTRNYFDLSEDPEENEHKLNQILDKILTEGKDSLTSEEVKFLQKFSRQLD